MTAIFGGFVSNFQLQEFTDAKTAAYNCTNIFKCILLNNQLDEAFFFIVRNEEMQITEMEALTLSLHKYRKELVCIHALLVCYIRVVKKYGENEYYPSFMLYKSKLKALSKAEFRMGVIKDVFIILSQLQIDLNKIK